MDRRNFLKAIGIGTAVATIPTVTFADGEENGQRKVEKYIYSWQTRSKTAYWKEVKMKDLRKGDWFKIYNLDGTLCSFEGDTKFCATEDPEQVNKPGEHERWCVPGKGLHSTWAEKYITNLQQEPLDEEEQELLIERILSAEEKVRAETLLKEMKAKGR